jgi:hypothetical protein
LTFDVNFISNRTPTARDPYFLKERRSRTTRTRWIRSKLAGRCLSSIPADSYFRTTTRFRDWPDYSDCPFGEGPGLRRCFNLRRMFRCQYEAAFRGWLIFLSCNTHMLGRLWGFRCLRGGVLRRGTQRGPRGRQIGRRAAACAGRLWAWRERVTRPSFQLRCVCHRSQAGVVSHARSLRNAVRVGRGGSRRKGREVTRVSEPGKGGRPPFCLLGTGPTDLS